MAEKLPAPSTLKARRRRSPIFVDEDIQWHMRTSKHDRCPWCGVQNLGYIGTRKRTCMNNACGIDMELNVPPKEWLEDKLEGGHRIDYASPPAFLLVTPSEEVFTLKEAQLRSNTGRGFVQFDAGLSLVTVFWHREGHLPERFDAHPACAGGSDYFWHIRELREKEVWVPDDPLCAMEVIAKAYGTDEPMFAIMSG